MSYARFSRNSDVYVYFSVGDYLSCCGCCMEEDWQFQAFSTQMMVDHLKQHIAKGHKVEDDVIPELLEDDKENFPND